MTTPRILALDLGTRTGWCAVQRDGYMDSGTWELAPRKGEGPGMRVRRFAQAIAEACVTWKPEVVVYEAVRRHVAAGAAHVYGALEGRLQEILEARGITYRTVEVAHPKQTATGKGNAKKPAMVAAANERWGLSLGPKDENEADARWIAQTWVNRQGAQ